jgi:hypothetical protein
MTNLSATVLSEGYDLTEGDMVAMQLNPYAQVAWRTISVQYDVLLFAIYNKTTDKIILHIYGTQNEIKAVQRTIGVFIDLLTADFMPNLKKNLGIGLTIADVRIVYRDRNEEGAKKILIWDDGKFRYPIDE